MYYKNVKTYKLEQRKELSTMKVLKRYVTTVFEDGTIKITPFEESHETIKSVSDCSSSIRQIVEVCDYVLEHRDIDIHFATTQGVNVVAAKYNITSSSVHSKLTRKLNLEISAFKKYLNDYIEGSDDTFEKILRNACVARTKIADMKAVEELLTRLH